MAQFKQKEETPGIIVKVPNAHKDAHFKEGDRVQLGWKAEDSRALDHRS